MRELTPLCLLAKKHETDKGGRHLKYGGADSDTCHEYTPIYWDLLAHKRERVARVLEIGVNAGSSLRLWRDFFPNATVYGLDCRSECLFQDERIICLHADQGSVMSLTQAVALTGNKPFDLIIDDGSHELHHQILSMQTLVRWLADDGIYVIEDMHDDCHPEIVGQHAPDGFAWRAFECEMGIGKAHCWCGGCSGLRPEQLLVVEHAH